MPGLNGWYLAKEIRHAYPNTIIIMTSANANENPDVLPNPSNGYLVKPLKYNELLDSLQKITHLQWQYTDDADPQHNKNIQLQAIPNTFKEIFSKKDKEELTRLIQIGYANAITSKLHSIKNSLEKNASLSSNHKHTIDHLLSLAERFQFAQLAEAMEQIT